MLLSGNVLISIFVSRNLMSKHSLLASQVVQEERASKRRTLEAYQRLDVWPLKSQESENNTVRESKIHNFSAIPQV